MLRDLLGRLVDAEIRRLTAERDQARTDRDRATRAAARWHAAALIHKARADALATTHTKEQ
ncbi:hypothetical protein [Micromonospora deserti]|uniref:Uncharacterized protein n=1 Tax=Micromonospora deserti TaxID=2070366 RepID=A0A2W2CGL3_9ACTN|nr:hypothetical protein [Micromonospora deserti]PZF98525.1 hypothetical protein C1I99_13270 [Micromonospora deserti]